MNIAGGFPVSVRRALLGGLLALPGILLPVAGAGAAVVAQPTTADGAQAAAAAIAAPGLVFGPASFQVIPAAGKTVGVSNAPLGAVLSPNGGSFAVLSSGDSTLAPNPQAGAANVSYSGTQNARGAYDVTVLVIPFTVPAGDDCLRFDYASYSEEALGSPFAEGLIAELDTSTWMSTGTTTSSPDNFATDATGTNGKPISVQSPMYFKTGVNGTIYNAGSALLRASTPITPGAHTLYLSVYDVGDSIIDAATFVDNLRTGPVANCVEGTTFAPALNVGDTTITEGDDGTKVASMTVSLPVANDETVTVDYATSNGTATAPGDYTPKTGSLTFAPGETIKTVNIDVLGDDVTEAGETVNLTLSNATAVPISDGTGVLTITNDDIANLSVSAVDVTEGNSGTTPSSFTITSSRLSQNPITVGYTTSPGTASAGSDYVTAAGTATIPAGIGQ